MKALIITGQGVQDQEFFYPYYRLQEEGYEVDVAIAEMEQVKGYFGIKIPSTHHISAVHPDNYEVLILPGGVKAMEHMRQDQRILDFIAQFHELGKVIGCICSATQLLISAGLVKGRLISGYYSMKDDIINAGGVYVDGVAIDSKIVTAPHYKYMGAWMKAVLIEVKKTNFPLNA